MSENEPLNTDAVANRVADWVSTALSVPLVWPKTTALVCLGVIVAAVGLSFVPRVQTTMQHQSNERRLQQMTDAVQRADERIRAAHPGVVHQDEAERGVWNVFQAGNQPPESAQTTNQSGGSEP